MATEAAIFATNFWNPAGWVAAGILAIELGVIAGIAISVGIEYAKKTPPPSKLKYGDKVKTPDSHPNEFQKNKDGSYTHKKTGWNLKKDPSGHGGDHYDAKPPKGKTGDYQNVYPDGTIR